jgi:hypothetical protein
VPVLEIVNIFAKIIVRNSSTILLVKILAKMGKMLENVLGKKFNPTYVGT